MKGPGNIPGGERALQDLQGLLEAYGANTTRWPVDDPRRTAAWALLQSGDSAAERMVNEAMALDKAMNALAAPAPSAALTGTVLQAAEKKPRTGLRDWTQTLWKPAGALACAAFLGVMVGVYSPVPVAAVAEQAASLETEVASVGGLDGGGFGELAE